MCNNQLSDVAVQHVIRLTPATVTDLDLVVDENPNIHVLPFHQREGLSTLRLRCRFCDVSLLTLPEGTSLHLDFSHGRVRCAVPHMPCWPQQGMGRIPSDTKHLNVRPSQAVLRWPWVLMDPVSLRDLEVDASAMSTRSASNLLPLLRQAAWVRRLDVNLLGTAVLLVDGPVVGVSPMVLCPYIRDYDLTNVLSFSVSVSSVQQMWAVMEDALCCNAARVVVRFNGVAEGRAPGPCCRSVPRTELLCVDITWLGHIQARGTTSVNAIV